MLTTGAVTTRGEGPNVFPPSDSAQNDTQLGATKVNAVRDIMTPNPTTISSGMLASEAARIMRDADIGLLPVLLDGRLEGVVTDRDLVTRALAERGDVPVGDVMTRNIVKLSPDDSIERAEQLMSENGVRRVVVRDGMNLVGIVSVGDLAVQVSDSIAGEVMSETGPDDRANGRPMIGGGADEPQGHRGGDRSAGIADRDMRIEAASQGAPMLGSIPATGLDGGATADDILESSRQDSESLERRDIEGGSNVRGGADMLGQADDTATADIIGGENALRENDDIGGSDAMRGEMTVDSGDDPLAGDAEVAGSRIEATRDGIAMDDEQNGRFGRG